jgi:transcriptional regulator with XRE-family HTH domain
MLLKKELGKKIKNIRKSKNITQERLAEIIGIDPKNVSRIENGNSYPSADTLTAIANALNVEIYELFIFKDNIPIAKMKNEIIDALDDDKTVLSLYKELKGF